MIAINTSGSDVELRVQLATIRRRLEQLEIFVAGHAVERPSNTQLTAIYVEAMLVLSRGRVRSVSAAAWSHVVLCLDEELLFRMGRLVLDPHPFVPLAQLIVALRDAGEAETVGAALAHLRSLARGILDAQGLELIKIEDLLGRRLPLVDQVGSVFDVQQGERHAVRAPTIPEGSVPISGQASRRRRPR